MNGPEQKLFINEEEVIGGKYITEMSAGITPTQRLFKKHLSMVYQ